MIYKFRCKSIALPTALSGVLSIPLLSLVWNEVNLNHSLSWDLTSWFPHKSHSHESQVESVPEVAPAPCGTSAASTAGAFHVGVGFSTVLSVIVAAIMRSLKLSLVRVPHKVGACLEDGLEIWRVDKVRCKWRGDQQLSDEGPLLAGTAKIDATDKN